MIPLTCDEARARLSTLLTGDEAGGEDLESHLAACPACRAQAEAWFRQDRALNELAATQQQERLRARLREALLNQTRQASATTRKPSSRRNARRARTVRREDRWPLSFTVAIAAAVLLVVGVFLALTNRPAPRSADPGAGVRPTPPAETDAHRERQRAIEEFRLAEERRREVAERFAEAERQRTEHERQLEEAHARAQEEAERQRIQAELAEARRKAEAERLDEEKELEQARSQSRTAQATVAQLAPTVTILGKVTFVNKGNRAALVRGGQRELLAVGRDLQAGDRIDTGAGVQIMGTAAAPGTEAVVELTCGARVDLAVNSLYEIGAPDTTTLLRGRLYADVDLRKAANGTPYVYFRTPHADVFVTGTRFDLSTNTVESRVRMEDGHISFENKRGSCSVKAMQECVASASAAPSAAVALRPTDLWRGRHGSLSGEIVLFPQDGQIVGTEWRVVPDADALNGGALEALATQSVSSVGAPARSISWVSFTFQAEANRDYRVWVRGRASKGVDNPIAHDAVWLDFPDAESVKASGANQKEVGDRQALINGYMFRDGYVWLSGDADPPGAAEGALDPLQDLPACTVRFARAGRQTIRLSAKETPIRIDAIWISETQKERPTWGPGGR